MPLTRVPSSLPRPVLALEHERRHGAFYYSDMPGGNPFGHLDLRVVSMDDALPFYEALLPALGFTERFHGPEWKVFATTGRPAAYFALVESAEHEPNANRIAFAVADASEVDRIAGVVADAGGLAISGPKQMPYGPDYYAVYFTDPSGNPLEVYHR